MSKKETQLEIIHHFDSGLCPPYEIQGSTLTFQSHPINVCLRNAPNGITVRVTPRESDRDLPMQGFMVSRNGLDYKTVPFQEECDFSTPMTKGKLLSIQFHQGGDIWLATCYPYGRNALEQLMCDTHGVSGVRTYLLRDEHRIVPVFEFGEDDGKKMIHFIVAGECAWETAGQWAGDAMIRELCSNQTLSDRLLKNAVVVIVPHTSPFSSTMPSGGYTTLEGKSIYGAATWGQETPPPEYALIRERVEKAIQSRRLGLLLTLHSYKAQRPTSSMEAIQSAGENELTGSRYEWTKQTLDRLIEDVPKASAAFPKKCWHAGLAREYLLRKYNVTTFRIEVTTYQSSMEFFQQTGQQLIRNISQIADWSPVFP
ncbi:hypothetical protein ACFL6S_28905 [Candidatus Poribacteria bacterium]